MRLVWMVLWIILFALLLTFLGVKWMRPRPVGPESRMIDAQLLELARETNQQWNRKDSPSRGSELSGPDKLSGSSSGIAGSLLELSGYQSRLLRTGVEVSLVEDLERWMLSGSVDTAADVQEVYFGGILQWLEPFVTTGSESLLSRVRLEPGSRTCFPDLYFELSGKPEAMGALLLESTAHFKTWRVREMELICKEKSDTWWMQGNCTFMRDERG